jgi:hypothetical protein
MAALRFPPPHTPPLKIYQPKKKYFCLSAGNTAKFMYKGAFIKQTTQKKPKTFRTLIRRIHISRKTARDKSNGPAAGRKNEKQETHPPFFFGP